MSNGIEVIEESSIIYSKVKLLSKILYFINVFSNRWFFLFTSIFILIISYLSAPYIIGATLITRAGTVVTILGLLLSIKHSFIVPNSDAKRALDTTESNGGTLFLKWEGETYSLGNIEKTYTRLSDEVFGFALIIVGTLFAAYGDFLPFYKMVSIDLCS